VIIKKPGTAGYEKSPAVIIQGHMDMVCEKSKESRHDFARDPLVLKIEDDFVRADSTTLGADNGIGVAYGLALLDSTDIPHPPLELLVTTNEETGMKGAHALSADHLTGKTLLKLGRILAEARAAGEFHIAAIAGGSKSNAIAREAQATVGADATVLERIESIVTRFSRDLKAEYATADPGITVATAPAGEVNRQLDAVSTEKVVDFLMAAPNGVQSMSRELEGLVESSLNLGILEQSGDSITVTVSVRSSVDSIREEIARRIETLVRLVNATSSRTGAYPGWQYEEDSPVRDVCVSAYKEVSGKDAQIQAIHAGLECGLLREKLPQTDMISFGPNLYNVHTPDEHLSITSVANTWTLLLAVLAKLK